jgi:hypothetical protein
MAPQKPRKELSEGQRGVIIRMCKCGMLYAAIARKLDLNYYTVRKVTVFYDETELVKPPPRPTCSTKLNECDCRHLKRHVKRDKSHQRHIPAVVTKQLDLDICVDTLITELKKLNLN